MIEPRKNKFYHLDAVQQERILDSFEHWGQMIKAYGEYKNFKRVKEIADIKNRISNFLQSLDIIVVYDWPGHRGEWFAPTEQEMEAYIDWCYQCRE